MKLASEVRWRQKEEEALSKGIKTDQPGISAASEKEREQDERL